MQYIIEKSKRFVVRATSEKEALKEARTFDDKNSLPYYEVLGVLGVLGEPAPAFRSEELDKG